MFVIEPELKDCIEFAFEKLSDPLFVEALKKVRENVAAIVIGPTGSGKSCLVNYLLGSRYDRVGKIGFNETLVLRQDSCSEKSITGQNPIDSQTLFPVIHSVPSKKYLLCDLAGIGDTRGKKFAISTSMMSQSIVEAARGIQKIILTLDSPTIMVSRGNNLSQYFVLLKNILGSITPERMSLVVIALTKFSCDIDNSKFIEQFIFPKLQELKGRQEPLTEDEKSILMICDYVVNHPEIVMFVDPCDHGDSAEKILSKIESNTYISSGELDLIAQEKKAQSFTSEILHVISFFNQESQRDATLSDRLYSREGEISDLTNNICNRLLMLNDSLSQWEEKSKKLVAAKLNCQRRIDSLHLCVETESMQYTQCREVLLQMETEHNRLTNLSQPVSVFVQSCVVAPYRDPNAAFILGMAHLMQHIRIAQKKPLFDQSYSFIFNSLAPILAVRLNGNELPRDCIVNETQLNYIHHYSLLSGTNAVLEVFIRECDTEANRKLIQALNEKILSVNKEMMRSHDLMKLIQEKLEAAQKTSIKINDYTMGMEQEKAHIIEAYEQLEFDNQKTGAVVANIEKVCQQDLEHSREFRRARSEFFPVLLQIAECLMLIGKSNIPESNVNNQAVKRLNLNTCNTYVKSIRFFSRHVLDENITSDDLFDCVSEFK